MRLRFLRGRHIAFLGLLFAIASAALTTKDCLAVTTVTVTPSTFTLGDVATPVTVQADTTAAGTELIFDVYIDVDGDGVLDPEDGRFQGFEIVDGQVPHLGNGYYWHDEDGATNSSISATLTVYGLWLFSGDFIIKVSDDDSSTASTSFTVEQNSSHPCVITGDVEFEGSPAGGAIVLLVDMDIDEDISRDVAGPDGTFELRAESPGEYGVYSVQVGAVTKYEEGSSQMITVSEGTNTLPDPLVLFSGDRTISGRVFASDTGEGFPGALIFAGAEGLFALTVTDDDGKYGVTVVDGVWDEVAVNEDQICRLGYVSAEERSITVSGSNVEGVGFLCRRATTLITGTVKDAETQQGLVGISVYAEEATGEDDGAFAIAYTGADGSYKLGVIEGQWWVDLEEDRLIGTGYADPPGQSVNAPASGTVSGIDFLLEKAGTITGHVYENDGVTPIEGASVDVHEFGTWNWVAYTETLPDGSYTLWVPSGTYVVRVFRVEGWQEQYYLKTANWEEATPVVVTVPDETSGIDFVLVPTGAIITGHVYEDDGVTPIKGAFVGATFFGPSSEWVASSQTGADGSYRLSVPTGTYDVVARDVPGWLDQYYDRVRFDDQATAVNAIVGQETSGIDFVLQPAATISGHVYQADGSTPISGAMAAAFDEAIGKWVGTTTGDDGSYSILVPGGSYKVWANADAWSGEFYDNTNRIENATVITVVAPEERAGIDFALLAYSATIKGHVYRQDGVTPIVTAWVEAYDYDPHRLLARAESADDGSYTLQVPPGRFRIRAGGWGCYPQYYASPVTVGDLEVMENIDFLLECTSSAIWLLRWSTRWAGGLELHWRGLPGVTYRVYWTPGPLEHGMTWHEVPNAQDDIRQEGDTMIWTDKGTAPGMNGKPPGEPQVRQRFYKVKGEPE
ncbi:hypothetical protein HQ563_05760 [bacterium]|nr:hypothetical protein [bacterium]